MARRSDPRAVGRDPDPRFTMANERTYLAWNRTALALIGGGLAAGQLLDFDSRATRADRRACRRSLLGLALALLSYRRWEANERALRLDEPLPTGAPRLLAVGVAVVGVIVTRGAGGRCRLLTTARAWRASAPGWRGSAARSASRAGGASMLSVAAHREAPGLLVVSAALVGVGVAVWRHGRRAYARRRGAGPAARARAHRPRHRVGRARRPRSWSSSTSDGRGHPTAPGAGSRTPGCLLPLGPRRRCPATLQPCPTRRQ